MNHYTVYYAKPSYAREFRNDPSQVDGFNFVQTHRRVHDLEANDLDDVFMLMQGEAEWLAPAEMRERIQSLGLAHTSMSVGDVIEFYGMMELDKEKHYVMKRFTYVVNFTGFTLIGPNRKPSPTDNF